jgi:K+-transporting ATPase A subunit
MDQYVGGDGHGVMQLVVSVLLQVCIAAQVLGL